MNTIKLGWRYVEWHYGRAFADILHVGETVLWFLYYFFSISLLARTLLSPWKRMDIDRGKHESAGDIFSRLIVNTIMRAVGVFMRTVLLIFGTIAVASVFFVEVLFAAAWVIMPLLALVFFIKGITLVF